MAQAELSIAPRVTGRARSSYEHSLVRELEPGDLTLLASEGQVATSTPPLIQRLRDRHHALARVLAQGMSVTEAALVTGYDMSRVSLLSRDPTFKALVEDYRKIDAGLQAEFMERAAILTHTAMANLQDSLENDESPLPASMVLEIAKFGADRIGHAPVQKSLNINANVDLGSRMAQARKRLAEVVTARKLESGE